MYFLGDWATRRKFLATGVHVTTVFFHPEMKMGAGASAGAAHVTNHLSLFDLGAPSNAAGKPFLWKYSVSYPFRCRKTIMFPADRL